MPEVIRGREMGGAQGIFRARNWSVMMETCHVLAQAHRMYTKSEPERQHWTSGDRDTSVQSFTDRNTRPTLVQGVASRGGCARGERGWGCL